jgi:hypothetical protein
VSQCDTMCEMTFPKPFGAVEAGSDGGHMATMWKTWEWWGWIGFLPMLNGLDRRFSSWKVSFSVLSAPPELPVFPFIVGLMGEYAKITGEGKPYKSCLLDNFRKLSQEKPEFVQNWGSILCMTDLGAGVDTMSQTFAAVINGICKNEQVYDRVRKELEAAVQSGAIVKGEPVPFDQATKLEYLQACMHEAMRLWPIIAIALPRTLRPKASKSTATTFPKATQSV